MPQLPKPSRTSTGVFMMAMVIVVLIAGTIMVARRENTTHVATSDGASRVTTPTQPGAAANTLGPESQETATSTEAVEQDTTATPATSSIETSQPATTSSPNSTGAPVTTAAPTSAAATIENSTSTSSGSTQTTGAELGTTTTSADLDSQGTTTTSTSTATTAPADSTTSTSVEAESTTTTTSATTEPAAPTVPNPLTVDVPSGAYSIPPSGSTTLILPKGTADPSVSGPLLLIRITSLVETNDERWEIRANGAGVGTVTARTATSTFVWNITTPAPGY